MVSNKRAVIIALVMIITGCHSKGRDQTLLKFSQIIKLVDYLFQVHAYQTTCHQTL